MMKKRTLAMTLSLMMVFSMMPVNGWAAEETDAVSAPVAAEEPKETVKEEPKAETAQPKAEEESQASSAESQPQTSESAPQEQVQAPVQEADTASEEQTPVQEETPENQPQESEGTDNANGESGEVEETKADDTETAAPADQAANADADKEAGEAGSTEEVEGAEAAAVNAANAEGTEETAAAAVEEEAVAEETDAVAEEEEEPVVVNTWTNKSGQEMSWSVDKGVLAIGGSGSMNGNTEQGFNKNNAPWKAAKEEVTEIVIGADVTSIGDYAFQDCKNLKKVTIENQQALEYIGPNAFAGCVNLVEVDLSGCENLTVLGGKSTTEGAFSSKSCRALVRINLDGCTGITEIGPGAFRDRRYVDMDLSSLENLRIIGYDALEDKHEFTTIDFSALTSLETIGDRAFQNNVGVVTLDMKGNTNLTTIGDYAFRNALGFRATLTSVDLSGCTNLTSIGAGAFQFTQGNDRVGRSGLITSVDLSGCDSLTELKDNTFAGQHNLSTISIPKNITKISSSAFNYCDGLRNLTWDAENYTGTIPQMFGNITNVVIGKDVQNLPAGFFEKLAKGVKISFEGRTENDTINMTYNGVEGTYRIDENGNIVEVNGNEYIAETSDAPDYTRAPKANTLVYTGSAQPLISEAKAADGSEMEYMVKVLDNGGKDWNQKAEKEVSGWSKELPQASEAGMYVVYCRAVKDGKVSAMTGQVRVNISRAKNPTTLEKTSLTISKDGTMDINAILRDLPESTTVTYSIVKNANGAVDQNNKEQVVSEAIGSGSGRNVSESGFYTAGSEDGVDVVQILLKDPNYSDRYIKLPIYVADIKAAAEPENSGTPQDSTDVEEPANTEEPTGNNNDPAGNDDPADTQEPAGSDDPADTQEPAGSDDPADTQEPAGSDDPADTQEPAGSDDPADTQEPNGNEEPADGEEPTVSEEPQENNDTEEPAAKDIPADTEEETDAEEPASEEPTGVKEAEADNNSADIEEPAAVEETKAAEEAAVIEAPAVEESAEQKDDAAEETVNEGTAQKNEQAEEGMNESAQAQEKTDEAVKKQENAAANEAEDAETGHLMNDIDGQVIAEALIKPAAKTAQIASEAIEETQAGLEGENAQAGSENRTAAGTAGSEQAASAGIIAADNSEQPLETIGETVAPLANGAIADESPALGHWVPLNVLCTILALMAAFVAFFRRRDDNEINRALIRGIRVITPIIAIVATVILILTQDFSGAMAANDEFTAALILMAAVNGGMAVCTRARGKENRER